MKITFLIFSCYFLFLVLQPGLRNMLDFGVAQTESCCDHACEPLEAGQTGNGAAGENEGKTCNPFQSCKCCIGYQLNYATQFDIPSMVLYTPEVNTSEGIPPHITIDFWQPPKLIS